MASGAEEDRAALIQWVPAALVFLGIVAISLTPHWDPGLPGPKHLPHVVAYAVFTLTLLAAAQRRADIPLWATVATGAGIVVLAIALGALLEVGQRAVHRDVQALDVVADAIGAGIGLVCWFVVRGVRALGRP